MKNLKKVLALVLAVAMLMGFATVASAAEYTDAADIDHSDAVLVLSSLGILDGFPDGTFQPKGTLTRGQAAKIVSIVHNATVAGKIQDIGALYANSADWFADSKDHWARAYINYCRVCKLADGMSATTFAPDGLLTGTQFLKMMLNVLGFVAEKEGYLGTGWDINVLERANQVGLTQGLGKNWKPADPVKRDEAAQIIYNALTCLMVEYGQMAKVYPDVIEFWHYINEYEATPMLRKVYTENDIEMIGKYAYKLPVAFLTGEVVDYTGYTLATAMGVRMHFGYDEFQRPGDIWEYNGKSYFFMYTPDAESWEAIGECDLLKELGYPETSTAEVPVSVYIDGVFKKNDTMTHAGKACLGEGREYGCQGTLTQAFKLPGYVLVTEIHTWLGKVKKVNGASHGSAGSIELEYWDRECIGAGYVTGDMLAADFSNGVDTDLTLTKGMYVLFSYSNKEVGTGVYGLTRPIHRDMLVVAPETKTGALKGAAGKAWPEWTWIDSTKYMNSCRFALGFDIFEENPYAQNLNGTVYTWFFDRKGNVIGRVDIAADAGVYYVIDKIWDATAHEDGNYVAKAVLVDLNANMINAVVDSFGFWGTDDAGNPLAIWYKAYELDAEPYEYQIHDAWINNYWWYDELYIGTQNKDNSYNLIDGITNPTFPVEEFVAHVATGDAARVAALENKDGTVYTNGVVEARLSESTRFLVKGVDGTYKAYTGYKALPTLVAYCNDMIDVDGDGFVDVVYLANAIYGSETVIGYVPAGYKEYNWRNGYKLIEVYVNGEKILLGVEDDVLADITEIPGLYEFRMRGDDEGVAAVELVELKEAATFTVVSVANDGTSAYVTSSDGDTLPSNTYSLIYSGYKFFGKAGQTVDATKTFDAGQTWKVYVINGVWYWFLQ